MREKMERFYRNINVKKCECEWNQHSGRREMEEHERDVDVFL